VNPTLLGALAALLSAGGTWDAQDKLLDRYEKRIEKLEDSVKTAVAEAAEAKSHNQSCERRLALIEHMLVDLGGILPPRDHG
jgi:ATP-dependent protease HslVU (ClpYQ) peptidase subunit